MLRDAILATLAYYDVLDMPLTQEEIFRYLVRKGETAPIPQAVQQELADLHIKNREGYYFLFDREYLVPLRKERERLAKRKWRKTMRAVRLMSRVPYVRGIFVSGSLSMNNTDELSDLDVIVVAKHGHIWTARFLLSLLLSILRMRRVRDDIVAPDKICANHFITDESLHIPFQSLYTAQLYANLVPVFADAELIKNFQIQNEWLFHFLHHWQMPTPSVSPPLIKGEGGRDWRWLERWARDFQIKRIKHDPTPLHPGGHLTYSDDALAFHARSSAQDILKKYENNQAKLTLGLL